MQVKPKLHKTVGKRNSRIGTIENLLGIKRGIVNSKTVGQNSPSLSYAEVITLINSSLKVIKTILYNHNVHLYQLRSSIDQISSSLNVSFVNGKLVKNKPIKNQKYVQKTR